VILSAESGNSGGRLLTRKDFSARCARAKRRRKCFGGTPKSQSCWLNQKIPLIERWPAQLPSALGWSGQSRRRRGAAARIGEDG